MRLDMIYIIDVVRLEITGDSEQSGIDLPQQDMMICPK